MTARSTVLGILLLSFFALSCGRIRVAAAPGGRMHITCAKGMKDCVTRAAKVCGDKGYRIYSGESRMSMLGGSSSAYRKPSESAELEVECGLPEVPTEPDIVFRLPPRKDGPAPISPADAAGNRCVPGATQRCIGPGACEGGQVCLGDGSGFGACDCGGDHSSVQDVPAPGPDPELGSAPAPQPGRNQEPSAPDVPGALPAPVPLSP